MHLKPVTSEEDEDAEKIVPVGMWRDVPDSSQLLLHGSCQVDVSINARYWLGGQPPDTITVVGDSGLDDSEV